MRTLVLVDGEHYPPVTRWGIETARARGHDVVGGVLVGGIEKIDPGRLPDLGIPLRASGTDRMASLRDAIDAFAPEAVLDLSDEPVMGYRERMELIAVALVRGLPYLGADFRVDPPISGPPIARADDRGDRHRQAHREDGDQRRARPARRARGASRRSSSRWAGAARPSPR